MKLKHILYFSVAGLSTLLWSCSDDILDKKPLDGYSEVDVFADEALLTNFVNGTYLGLRHPFRDENTLTDGLTDNAYNQHGSAVGTVWNYTRAEVNQDNGEAVTNELWSHAYGFIRRSNLFFEKAAASSIDPEALTQLSGEMQFLRAYQYFDLMRWYGGVPLITSTFGLDDESYAVNRNTADEVAAFVVSECDEAIAKLPSMSDPGYVTGRASVEAAMALKARTLLYAASPLFNASGDQAKWTAARDANKAVMELSSVSLVEDAENYGEMFQGYNSQEVIFARYFTEVVNQGWGANLWLFPNSNGGWANTTPTQDLVDHYELTNGKLPEDPSSGYNPQDPYVNRDPRFYESVLYNGAPFKGEEYEYFVDADDPTNPELSGKDSPYSSISPHNASRTGYNFRKWTLESEGEYSGNTGPWIVFRLGEFYLNYAEAQLALGEEEEARTAINAVRTRVGMPPVTESGEALVERYRNERRIELVLEDHRFFDFRRWMIGPEVLNKPALGVQVIKDGTTLTYDFGKVATDQRKWNDRLYLLPIPSGEIQRSGSSLSQNPGY
ncbi:Starch-binding associating with outer membrane [Catalinimonas alkaloidigena]|uniref:Starch-binding associating with outer membrane n=1 Tax=Catalinimonas alkaloidigena TaxID=1075417 RepID=A0A1G8YEG4_9BACT|nr:RagB/SusD family nutrient uptake outer membrane protein [Catalinimonas alkaloidigena]SDK01238.1 Starch-binding associating with outer membrane [Catalinimonas alkaloidigena]